MHERLDTFITKLASVAEVISDERRFVCLFFFCLFVCLVVVVVFFCSEKNRKTKR